MDQIIESILAASSNLPCPACGDPIKGRSWTECDVCDQHVSDIEEHAELQADWN